MSLVPAVGPRPLPGAPALPAVELDHQWPVDRLVARVKLLRPEDGSQLSREHVVTRPWSSLTGPGTDEPGSGARGPSSASFDDAVAAAAEVARVASRSEPPSDDRTAGHVPHSEASVQSPLVAVAQALDGTFHLLATSASTPVGGGRPSHLHPSERTARLLDVEVEPTVVSVRALVAADHWFDLREAAAELEA